MAAHPGTYELQYSACRLVFAVVTSKMDAIVATPTRVTAVSLLKAALAAFTEEEQWPVKYYANGALAKLVR